MRLPNGYGSVYKLSGNRRKPWGVRKTIGWEIDENTGRAKQKYQIIGYYKTRQEALKALADFNENPYSLDKAITFAELYEKWSNEKFEATSDSSIKAYKASYKVCGSLYDMKFTEIRKNHLQHVVDSCGKNYPTLRKLKVLFNQLYRYAMENDICAKDYSSYVDIAKYKEKGKQEKHKQFKDAEIQKLWDNVDRNEYIQIILMLIYNGVRISEFLDLKKSNVHLEEKYFDVVESKTESGIRKVPIADKVMPFYVEWMQRSKCEYLICTRAGSQLKYANYKDAYWMPLMDDLNMSHLPHDTRHTTVSLLARADVNQTIIKRIVGHSGAMSLTERVHTHVNVQELLDAINKI